MLNQLKSFFSKFKRQPEQSSPPPPAAAPAPQTTKPAQAKPSAPVAKPQPAPAAKPVPQPKSAAPAATPAPSPAPAAAPVAAPAIPGVPDETIALPLKVVLGKLPAALSALVRSSGGGDVEVSLRKVLAQLPQGSVKVSFGELRQGAPAGTFLDVTSQDETMVELPLPEILSRLNPSLLSRRPSQKTVEVPPEVGNVFGPRGETLISGGAAAKAPASAPSAPRIPTPTPAPSVKPLAPAAPSAPKVAATPAPAQPKPSPIAAPNLPKPATPAVSTPAPKISMPAASKPAEPVSAASGEILTLPLANLSESWPEAIRDEIKQQKLSDASVGLPMDQVEIALRSGKIVFPWRQISAWLKPNPLASSPNGDTPVELPLKVVAPLFISQHRPAKPQKKVAVGENIPDIFNAGTADAAKAASAPVVASAPAAPAAPIAPSIPKPSPIAPSIPKPTPTAPSLPKPPATSPAIAMPKPSPTIPAPAAVKEPTTIGEVFGNPAKKDWPPNEIVQKTSALKGMSGALMATNDGLLIAGQLAAPLKPDTIAAFLPQIFGRMSQYGKELGAGDASSLTVEFSGVSWHIVKLGHIYFAAIGKAGEPLPTSLIRVITSELGKQK